MLHGRFSKKAHWPPEAKKLQVAVSIKIAREKQGYTQQQMAEKIGIKQQNISRYEKGKVIPSADRFLELVGA